MRVQRRAWGRLALMAFCASTNTVARAVQALRYRARLEKTLLRDDPIFIVGHWRSGTTFLHELLGLSPEVSFLNNYCAFTPHHFLLTERMLGCRFDLVAPLARPGDQVDLTWDSPQEEEFAVMALGAPSPYWRFVFPGSRLIPFHRFNYDDDQWFKEFVRLAQMLTFRSKNRLVFKSPANSFRICKLAELFPRSVFIHLSRKIEAVVTSFDRFIRAMTSRFSYSRPLFPETQELREGYRCLEQAAYGSFGRLSESRWLCVSYEALCQEPLAEIARIAEFAKLELSDHWRIRLDRHLRISGEWRP